MVLKKNSQNKNNITKVTLLHTNKNTLLALSRKSTAGLVYLYAGEISSASHSAWLWPSQASS